ncbi:hypothetical protein GIV90_25375, partial [Pseudomonas syringae]|nr:hypothetical protein [Pseudomonas syringae]
LFKRTRRRFVCPRSPGFCSGQKAVLILPNGRRSGLVRDGLRSGPQTGCLGWV